MSLEYNGSARRTIRRLQECGLPGLLSLHAHLHRSDDPQPDDEAVKDVWDEIVRGSHFYCFGGYVEGLLVSSCTLAVVPNLTRGCRPYGVIENVVTHREHRNRGWAKAILHHALEMAWQRRCHKVVLTTGRTDEEIVRFYEGVGFDSQNRRAFVARPQ
jgi:ribosomal protein S18 acetylase RimI-like enzyme